jgi:hypothetical protein
VNSLSDNNGNDDNGHMACSAGPLRTGIPKKKKCQLVDASGCGPDPGRVKICTLQIAVLAARIQAS